MSKKYFVFPLLIILLLTFSFSQTNLSYAKLEGNIYHKDDGKPIEGAIIRILGTDCIGISDEDGRYVIKNIPIVGEQETFTIDVYEPNLKSIVLRRPVILKAGTNQIDFSISLSELFKKYFGNFDQEFPFSIKLTNDSCYLISGKLTPINTNKSYLYLLKVDKYGRKVWGRTYSIGEDLLNAYVDINDNEYIVTATAINKDKGHDIYLLKLDSNGKIIWEKNYGRSDWDEMIKNFIITKEREIVAVGLVRIRNKESIKSDNYIVKFNKNGEKIWDKVYGDKGEDYFEKVIQASNGDYIIVGSTTPTDKPSYATYYRIDRNSNLIWNKEIKSEGPVYGKAIIVGPQGYVIVGNEYKNLQQGIFLVYINDKGDVLIRKNYSKKGRDTYVTSIAKNSKNYILAGYVNENKINNSYILKLDLNWNFVGEIVERKDFNNFITDVISEKDIYFIFLGYLIQDQNMDIYLYKISL